MKYCTPSKTKMPGKYHHTILKQKDHLRFVMIHPFLQLFFFSHPHAITFENGLPLELGEIFFPHNFIPPTFFGSQELRMEIPNSPLMVRTSEVQVVIIFGWQIFPRS